MTDPAARTVLHRLIGLTALLSFAVFMGSILLAKMAMMGDFTAPRFSAQTEFMLVLGATFLAIIYLLQEERRRAQRPLDPTDQATEFQPEEEKQ
ncbi:hypothetical protein [Roseovarius sp.]|uniref:hypothetical protein n=1 Tax=Roseovarius sp. TaxID=1486281 RepID=UPI00356808CF